MKCFEENGMKMTSIEKGVVVVMVLLVAAIVCNFMYVSYKIDKAGGLKAVIVEAGKEVKDIKKQINSAP